MDGNRLRADLLDGDRPPSVRAYWIHISLLLASVVLYSLLIEIMPLLCPILASGCKWDNPRSERTHMLWGFFFGRVIGLLVLGLGDWHAASMGGGDRDDTGRIRREQQ